MADDNISTASTIIRRSISINALAHDLVRIITEHDTRWDFSAQGIIDRAYEIAAAAVERQEQLERKAVEDAKASGAITLDLAQMLGQCGSTETH